MSEDLPVIDDAPEAQAAVEVELLHGVIVSHSHDQVVLHPSREEYLPLLSTLHGEGWFSMLDLCGVDYLENFDRPLPDGVRPERFEIVVQLINHRERARLRLRIQIPADDAVLGSATDLYPGADAPEREAFDMFGIVFDGHPDLTRILMPEDWVGHPLRKDYDLGRIPVQFKGAPAVRS